MKAVKANKEYTIDDASKPIYKKDGFDIYDDAGNLLEYGAGKTVPYETYMAVKNELDKLKESGEKKTTRGAKA